MSTIPDPPPFPTYTPSTSQDSAMARVEVVGTAYGDEVRADVTEHWDALLADRDRLHKAALDLARWTMHKPSCARNTEAGDCSCGLQEAWKEIR